MFPRSLPHLWAVYGLNLLGSPRNVGPIQKKGARPSATTMQSLPSARQSYPGRPLHSQSPHSLLLCLSMRPEIGNLPTSRRTGSGQPQGSLSSRDHTGWCGVSHGHGTQAMAARRGGVGFNSMMGRRVSLHKYQFLVQWTKGVRPCRVTHPSRSGIISMTS